MHQYSQGRFTTQGHKGIPEGHFEEEQGRKGFFGPVSHLIKPQPSTRWTNVEGPLRPHLYDLVKMPKTPALRQRLLFNSDVVMSNLWMSKTDVSKPVDSFRDADGDQLYFVHKGRGEVFTEYGLLSYEPGSYISIPKCVTHAFAVVEDTQFFVIESCTGSFREPDRGMLGRNAFYDPAALGKPNLDLLHSRKKQTGFQSLNINVKKFESITRFDYAECIYDTVGWKGDFFPFTLHIRDLMPIVSARVHLPPSVHTTFVANGFVVCTFLPRPLETDADALKVPFYHQNIDYDEVLFYHEGNFFSRDNLHAGMITLHPAGFPHGPHPKAIKNVNTKTHTDEVAVMVDSWQPLYADAQLGAVEVDEYWKSWMK